jgi:hypothetical protein
VQTDKLPSTSEPLIQKNRPVRILARSIFRELKSQGYDDKQILGLATELLSEVTMNVTHQASVHAAAQPGSRHTK